jgi:hypothetical protein
VRAVAICLGLSLSGVAPVTAAELTHHAMHEQILGMMKTVIPYDPSATAANRETEPTPGVILMPQMIVHDRWQGTIDAEKFLTPAALAKLLAKQYPGMLQGGKPTDYTDRNVADRKRMRNMTELTSFATMLHDVGDVGASKELTKLIDSTFARQRDPKTDAIDKWVNWNRR